MLGISLYLLQKLDFFVIKWYNVGKSGREFMFRGLTAVALDTKGRLSIPARYRRLIVNEASGWVVCTIDTEDPCLLLYPYPAWESIERKLEALPTYHPDVRRIQRLLIGHATELELDGHGRMLIPNVLRDYAALTQRVMLVGQGKKFEIWSEGAWESVRKAALAHVSDADQLPLDVQNLSL